MGGEKGGEKRVRNRNPQVGTAVSGTKGLTQARSVTGTKLSPGDVPGDHGLYLATEVNQI